MEDIILQLKVFDGTALTISDPNLMIEYREDVKAFLEETKKRLDYLIASMWYKMIGKIIIGICISIGIIIIMGFIINDIKENTTFFDDDRCCTCACYNFNDSGAIGMNKLENGDCVCQLGKDTFIV